MTFCSFALDCAQIGRSMIKVRKFRMRSKVTNWWERYWKVHEWRRKRGATNSFVNDNISGAHVHYGNRSCARAHWSDLRSEPADGSSWKQRQVINSWLTIWVLLHFLWSIILAVYYISGAIVSSVRSSNSHPDLLLIHHQQHPHFLSNPSPIIGNACQ